MSLADDRVYICLLLAVYSKSMRDVCTAHFDGVAHIDRNKENHFRERPTRHLFLFLQR